MNFYGHRMIVGTLNFFVLNSRICKFFKSLLKKEFIINTLGIKI